MLEECKTTESDRPSTQVESTSAAKGLCGNLGQVLDCELVAVVKSLQSAFVTSSEVWSAGNLYIAPASTWGCQRVDGKEQSVWLVQNIFCEFP